LQKLIALGEHHQKEIQALKEEHAQEILLERDRELNASKEEHERQMRVCTSRHIDVVDWHENAGEMVMQR
jgi:hypothetical protein